MEFLRPLEINVLSAHGLKDVNLLSKMNVYAFVSIGNDPTTMKRTPVDRDGGKSPKWNHRTNFTVDENVVNNQPNLCLWFRIKTHRPLGDRDIGHVAVPLKELLERNPKDGERTVEYQVRTPDGKAKGTLKFAYKFGDRFGTPAAAAAASSAVVAAPKMRGHEPMTAYPAAANTAYTTPPTTGYAPPPAGYAAPYAHPPPADAGYGNPPPAGYAAPYAHPPPANAGYAYPPQHQAYPVGYPPAPGYGYQPPQQQGYGYPAVVQQAAAPKTKKSKMGMGMGAAGLGVAGLGAGLLGGFLVGDMAGHVSQMATDYGDVCDDGGFVIDIDI